nr:MAG TPA: Spike glycoprotein Intermediate, Trimer, Coiled-coil, VIRAL [Caudoviricetes sp.]
MELHREIDRLNTEFEKCNNELIAILNKLESYCK